MNPEIKQEFDRVSQQVLGALKSLESMILLHYHAVQDRGDHFAKRLDRIEKHLDLKPLD